MPVNPSLTRRFCYATLLAMLVFFACASGGSAIKTSVADAAASRSLHGPAQAHDQTKRRLGIPLQSALDRNDEERGIANNPTVAKALYKWTANKQKAAERLFTRFKLGQNTPDMFTNAKFLEWGAIVAKSFKKNPGAADEVMYVAMNKQLGNKGLAKVLATAKDVSSKESIAGRLQGLQFANWARSGETADKAIGLLGLNGAGEKLFASPEFRSWISYLDLSIAKAKKPDELSHVVAMYSLIAHQGDEALVKAAKEVSSTRAIATKLENVLVSQWIGEQKTGIEAFKLLKLDEAGESIFQTPAFHTWARYANKMKKTHSSEVALGDTLAILKKRFDEVDLSKLLLVAKADTVRAVDRQILSDLQRLQFTSWRARGENPDTVARRLLFMTGADKRSEGVIVDYYNFYRGIEA